MGLGHNTLTLLYHVGDLLSLKGNMEFHSDIYELIIRFLPSTRFCEGVFGQALAS